MPEVDVRISMEALLYATVAQTRSDYCVIMRRLHGVNFTLDRVGFLKLLQLETELVVFVYEGTYMVATAQASFCQTPPRPHILINNVVVRDGYDGKGYGKLAMQRLEAVAKRRWAKDTEVQFVLTNSPKKNNGGFYRSLGYEARSEGSANPTVVWIKAV